MMYVSCVCVISLVVLVLSVAKVTLDVSKKLIDPYVWLIVTDTIYYVLLVSCRFINVLRIEFCENILWMALNFTVNVCVGLTGEINFSHLVLFLYISNKLPSIIVLVHIHCYHSNNIVIVSLPLNHSH